MSETNVQATKRCSKCGKEKPAGAFRREHGKPGARCKECVRVAARAQRRAAGKMPKSLPLEARFWAKVAKGARDACWPWQGTGTRGYGKIHDKVTGKMIRATQVAWELANGPLPAGAHILHKCDRPPCVNPDHLFLGTNDDNIADKLRKGRQRNGAHVYRGERHHGTSLTTEQVLAIRAEAATSGRTMAAIGSDYGITRESVGAIVRRKRWAHLAPAPGDDAGNAVG